MDELTGRSKSNISIPELDAVHPWRYITGPRNQFASKLRPKPDLELSNMYDSMEAAISEAEIREELRLLLQSKSFQQSQRLIRFLNFTVARAITDKLEDLKEYTI